LTKLLLCLFLLCGLANFACSILILRGLAKLDIKVGFYELRWQVHKHLKHYKRSAREKNGLVAWPYYSYWLSLVGMILSAMLGLSLISR